MKLNPECIRAILLVVEEKTKSLNDYVEFRESNQIPELLSNYSMDEIMYHVKQCELSGMFGGKVTWNIYGDCMIQYLSPEGHQFLSDIRSDSNWNRTKEIAQNVHSNSLDALKDIASGVIASLIQDQLA